MNTLVDDDRVRALENFANSGSGSGVGHVPTVSNMSTGMAERVFGAQQVAVHRDEARILQKLSALGAAAGDGWFYRFPVRNRKKGTTDYIEGPSIKLANDLARIYGNCEIDVRVVDLGSSWLIYARFIDYETGFALTRPFQQNKGGAKLGGDDDARRLDIALQIGVSKAQRNVVVNALQTFADHAFDAARHSLVEKIGKNIQGYRDRTVQGIENLGVELVRVELVVGKSSKDWTAPDVARVIAMMKGIADGMATVDETFPPRDEKKVDGDSKLDQFAGDTNNTSSGGGDATVGTADASAGNGPAGAGAAADTKSQVDAATSPQASAVKEGADGEGGDGGSTNASNASAPSKPTETAKAEDPDAPKNDSEYRAYAGKWIEETTNRDARMARWSREKAMRNKANVTPETRDFLDNLVKKKD